MGQTPDILITGFWNVSETDEIGIEKVIYALIAADGVVTEYYDDQNAGAGGRNCFTTKTNQLTAFGNNQYQQTDPIDGDVYVENRQWTAYCVRINSSHVTKTRKSSRGRI